MMGRRGGPKKVVGIGLTCLDHLILWRDMQAPVSQNKIVDYQVQGGGMVGTALVAVARLGGEAEYWGAVGTDWMGEMVVEGLRREHVDTRHLRAVPGGRGPMVVVCVDQPTGERRFLYWTGLPEFDGSIGSEDSLAAAGCLLVDGTFPKAALAAAQAARRLGVPVVGDFGHVGDSTRTLLAHVDHAIVSEGCTGPLGVGDDYRAACEAVRAMGPGHVAVTLGDRGLVSLDGGQFRQMEAFAVQPVDTTGAGDAFHGAFCYGLVEGFPLAKNLEFASAAAALNCRRPGGRAGLPSRDEVLRFLNERGVDWP